MTGVHASTYAFSPKIADANYEVFRTLLASLGSLEKDWSVFSKCRERIYEAAQRDAAEYTTQLLHAAFAASTMLWCTLALSELRTAEGNPSFGHEEVLQNAISATCETLLTSIRVLEITRRYDVYPQLYIERGYPIERIWPDGWQRSVREEKVQAPDSSPDKLDAKRDVGLSAYTRERFRTRGIEGISEVLFRAQATRRKGGNLLEEIFCLAARALLSLYCGLLKLVEGEGVQSDSTYSLAAALRSAGLLDDNILRLVRELAAWYFRPVSYRKRGQIVSEGLLSLIECSKASVDSSLYLSFRTGGFVVFCAGDSVSVLKIPEDCTSPAHMRGCCANMVV